MVIERPISGHSPWDETQHSKLSRRALVAIALVAAVHVAGGAYLYRMRTAPPHVPLTTDAPVIEAVPIRLKHDQPPPVKPPPKVVQVHSPAPSDFKAPTTLPVPPQTPHAELASDGPPILTPQTTSDVGTGLTPTPPKPKVIANPTWLARPSAAQLSQFYPPRALDNETAGQATLDCLVTAQGQLTHCTISGETPRGAGFGEAAMKASRIFRMSPKTEDGQPVEGGEVHIPMRFAVTT